MPVFEDDEIKHYGILRRSGRYPWGSGGDVPERSRTFLDSIKELSDSGMSESEIAEAVGLTTKQLRETKSIARAEHKAAQVSQAQRLKDKGMSTSEIGRRMGLNESSVRGLLAPGADYRAEQLRSLSNMLRDQANEKTLLDVGKGVSNQLGVSPEVLGTALAILRDEGYEVHRFKKEQEGTGLLTEYKVLVPPGVTQKDVWMRRGEIQQINVISNDSGNTYLGLKTPMSIDSSRIKVRYAEDGGTDSDGTMWVRPGVEDVSLGGSNYAQVRVAVDGTHYLKGMAVYKDDLPAGVDIVFNTNKSNTGNTLDALKPMKRLADGSIDPDNPFGSSLKRQIIKLDADGKERLTSVMNIVNEESDWSRWSSSLSSQMLSKQSRTLAKKQLAALHDRRKDEFDELDSLTNPEVKRKLLLEFADSVDSDAVHLQAASFPRTSTHVLIPMNFMKENEVYAPNYRDGERVVLIRHPHGGKFEIPELVVNNKNPNARKMLGTQVADAVGIHSRVAERLSGADFDGDTVLVIPNDRGEIKTAPALKALVNYDPKALYKLPEDSPIPRMTERQKGIEMGKISNLITDMTIAGAPQEDIARAVRHSMVVIDAEKHGLNYRQSELDNNIANLRSKYLSGSNGASTLISRARSEKRIPQVVPRAARDGGPIDKNTGKRVYVPTGATYVNKKGKTVLKTTKFDKLDLVDDAYELSSGTPIESIYAEHSNRLKAMANAARKEAVNLKTLPYSPSAKAAYAKEVASLNAKLDLAIQNSPRERQAQLVAETIIRAKRKANPDMTSDELKKIKGQALVEARLRVGAKKDPVQVTDSEWAAIQAGAISPSKLREILAQTNTDHLKKLATPRTESLMTSVNLSKARAMVRSGHTQSEIAEALGVSLTTLKTSLAEDGG